MAARVQHDGGCYYPGWVGIYGIVFFITIITIFPTFQLLTHVPPSLAGRTG
jgi:hypothetical protein